MHKVGSISLIVEAQLKPCCCCLPCSKDCQGER